MTSLESMIQELRRMDMARRGFLIGALALGGCQLPDATTMADVVQKTKALADGLAGILPALGAVAGIDPKVVAEVGGYIANIEALATAIAGASTRGAAQPLITQIEGYVNAILGVLVMVPLPPPLPMILQAAAVAVPIIEGLLGMAVKPSAPRTMTDMQVFNILRDSAKNKR
jgi:hypothetical protein